MIRGGSGEALGKFQEAPGGSGRVREAPGRFGDAPGLRMLRGAISGVGAIIGVIRGISNAIGDISGYFSIKKGWQRRATRAILYLKKGGRGEPRARVLFLSPTLISGFARASRRRLRSWGVLRIGRNRASKAEASFVDLPIAVAVASVSRSELRRLTWLTRTLVSLCIYDSRIRGPRRPLLMHPWAEFVRGWQESQLLAEKRCIKMAQALLHSIPCP